MLDVVQGLIHILRDERETACERYVEDNADTPNVRLEMVRRALNNLWREESDAANGLLGALGTNKNP